MTWVWTLRDVKTPELTVCNCEYGLVLSVLCICLHHALYSCTPNHYLSYLQSHSCMSRSGTSNFSSFPYESRSQTTGKVWCLIFWSVLIYMHDIVKAEKRSQLHAFGVLNVTYVR